MDEREAQARRFEGTVAVFFTGHYQRDPRDWNNIREFDGQYHPLYGYYRGDEPEILRRQLHEMRRAGIDTIVYDCDNHAIDEVEWENEFFTLRRIRPYHSDVWSYVEHYPQRLSREWMAVSPGSDPFLEHAYLAKYVQREAGFDLARIRADSRAAADERNDGDYFRKQLLRARFGDPDIIFISGWNDWQYANQIEPAVEYGYRYVDLAASLLGRAAETAPYRGG